MLGVILLTPQDIALRLIAIITLGNDIRTEANASGTTGNIDSTIADVLKTNTNETWADVVRKGLDTSGERRID